MDRDAEMNVQLGAPVTRTQLRAFALLLSLTAVTFGAEASRGDGLEVRAFCVASPKGGQMEGFLSFVENELSPRRVNTLVLMVNYGYQFTSRPEMRDESGISLEEAKKLAKLCRAKQIRLIPLINLLGHQSWNTNPGQLLRRHPEFDETPWVTMPEKFKWPNPDGLYCKSYCTLHPEVHPVVFSLVDEVCDAFDADTFHAGLDEVFYIGEKKCARCGDKDKAILFADEIRRIHAHLASNNRKLWMWGDRLLEGSVSGLGEWEASLNNTHPAIDFIPKDITICDWHYVRPYPTAVYFAIKGFPVISCGWRNETNTVIQARDMLHFKAISPKKNQDRYLGLMQTVWSSWDGFFKEFSAQKEGSPKPRTTPISFNKLFEFLNQPAPLEGALEE